MNQAQYDPFDMKNGGKPVEKDELREQLESLDIDFGYAVGNLGEDCKDNTVDTIISLINSEKAKLLDELEAYAESSNTFGIRLDAVSGFIEAKRKELL